MVKILDFLAVIEALRGATADLKELNDQPSIIELDELEEIEPIVLDYETIEELANLD